MLSYVKTARSSAIAALLALSLALPAAPAFAWDQREQDVLKGVLGTLAATALVREVNKNRAPAPQFQFVDTQRRYGPVYGNNFVDQPRHSNQGYSRQFGATNVYNTAAALAFNSYTRPERRAIQRHLARQGYYNGALDGAFGPGTYRAIAAYARSTGNLDRLGSRNGAYAVYDGLIF